MSSYYCKVCPCQNCLSLDPARRQYRVPRRLYVKKESYSRYPKYHASVVNGFRKRNRILHGYDDGDQPDGGMVEEPSFEGEVEEE